MRTRVWMTAVVVCAVAACGGGGGDGGGPGALGERTATADVGGLPSVGEGDARVYVVNFGVVPVGRKAQRRFGLGNRGTSDLLVRAIDADLNPFDSNLACPRGGSCPDRRVEPGTSMDVVFSFSPVNEAEVVRELELETNAGRLRVRLSGRGAVPSFVCSTPTGEGSALDFGHLVRGTSLTRKVTCENRSPLDAVLQVLPVTGPNADSFTWSLGSADGKVLVPAGRSVEIPVTFVATRVLENFATLNLQVEGATRLAPILLTGRVLDHALEIDPPGPYDFGFVKPGTSREILITLRNLGSTPLEVRDFGLDAVSDGAFSLVPPAPFTLGGFNPDVPGANEVQATLRFAPTSVGEQTAQIDVVSEDPADPVLALPVRGFGGGPTVACAPREVGFGPTASGVPRTREIVCSNVTEYDDPDTDADRLQIGEPFMEAAVSDFRVRVKDGIRRDGYGVGESFTLLVTYDPSADGESSDRVVLRTNDTAHLEYAIAVDGVGRVLPPCAFEVRPASGLRFGTVAPRRAVTLEVAVVNLQDTACLLQDVTIGKGSDPAFRLGDPEAYGLVPYLELAPGGEVRIPVTYAPIYRTAAAEGELRFRVNVPGYDEPDKVVKLSGACADPCLVVTPPEADLGVVAPACATRTRSFQLINVCSVPVDVTGIGIPADQPSREFHLTRSPFGVNGPDVITLAGAGDGASFEVDYRPDASGEDVGAVWVRTAQQDEPTLVVLHGEGNRDATQTDRFRQQANPRVDILWVVSNHDTMGTELRALREHASDFWETIAASGVDFQLGVTTTGTEFESYSCSSGGVGGKEDGRLVPVDGSAPRIIRPETPDGLARWLVDLGKVEACQYYEGGVFAGYQAVTEPMATSADDPRYEEKADGNAGFLRGDALLSVIYFSDFADSYPSPQKPTSFYLNGMLAAKGFDASKLLVHGFVNGRGKDGNGACSSAAGVGTRYQEMIRGGRGHEESICPEDWSLAMRSMAQAALGMKSCFPLTGQPGDADGDGAISDATVPPELEVRLDGRRFESTGERGNRQWEYVPERNEVCFFPLALPEPGTGIEMTYGVACGE